MIMARIPYKIRGKGIELKLDFEGDNVIIDDVPYPLSAYKEYLLRYHENLCFKNLLKIVWGKEKPKRIHFLWDNIFAVAYNRMIIPYYGIKPIEGFKPKKRRKSNKGE